MLWACFLAGFLCVYPQPNTAAFSNAERLPPAEIRLVQDILQTLEPRIRARETDATLATMTFEELYAPLDARQTEFLRAFQKFDPLKAGMKTTWHGIATGREKLRAIRGQQVLMNGKPFVIPVQVVPPRVFKAFERMMRAMEKELGRRLYIESGYRSSAYQLYLFIFYLKNHEYSVRETAHWIAFPGYSEHGNPRHQALDFINAEGISGETDPKAFENLPEYAWLLEHAAQFGFVLSFPKTNPGGVGFEPWHWRYEGRQAPALMDKITGK